MNPDIQTGSKHALDTLPPSVAWRRRCAFLLMLIERLWPLVSPLIMLSLAFFSCVWFGIFVLLPLWFHAGLLLAFVVITIWLLLRFLSLRLPNLAEIDRHIEGQTRLSFQPLAAQSDEIFIVDGNANTLWFEHRRRMRQHLRDLQIGMPVAQMPKRDPHALRSLVFLSFAIAYAYSFSPAAGQLKQAFTFSVVPNALTPMRIDGWINPPEYTGIAPLYLNFDVGAAQMGEHNVPYGSTVHFRIMNAQGAVRLRQKHTVGASEPVAMQTASSQEDSELYQLNVTEDVSLQLDTPLGQKSWFFTVIADAPPQIDWLGEPRRARQGLLEIAYQIDDDYGATKAWASIKAIDGQDQALYLAPQLALSLPRGGKGATSHRQDFTNHPWAGMEVEMILYVEDGAGQIAASKPLALTLPQRIFANKLARAVIEQRRLLIQNRNNRDIVADMLAAILVRPQDTIRNATHVISLQSAWTRLSYIDRDNDENLRSLTDYLWQIALGIEDDGLSQAEQRLRQAQQALRDALRDGAGAQEIERLMQELRQAMRDYIAALAEQQMRDQLSAETSDGRALLQDDELEKRLQQLEEMAKLGARGAAEQLLNELENLLDNLQIIQGRNGEGEAGRNERSALQQNMDNLADMLRRQQEMMNETNRLTQEWQNGERSAEEYGQAMEGLAGQQEELRGEWESLYQDLRQQGMENGDSMGEAGQEMGQARDFLGLGDGFSATDRQGRALEAMRRAGQDMIQAMREQGSGQSEQSGDLDPLGRARQNGQASGDSEVKVPTEMDVERARRILDEIRARLGHMTPPLERQYLERLLNFDERHFLGK